MRPDRIVHPSNAVDNLDRPARVIVADDCASAAGFFRRVLEAFDFRVATYGDGASALAAVTADPPDLLLADLAMPGLDGLELCRRVKASPSTRLVPVVLVTGAADRHSRMLGLDAGADEFLAKPVDPHELAVRARSLVRIKHYTDELESADAVMRSLGLTVEARDPFTVGHCQRLASYATALGERLGLGRDDLVTLEHGAYLHDVGKIAIPDAILLKPGRLSAEEFEVMKTHVTVGDALLGPMRTFGRVRPIVRCHHERIDGSGYPSGLRGDAVPILAQIVGIVDVFDALTSVRPYKPALPIERAVALLELDGRHGVQQSDLVAAFVSLVLERSVGAKAPTAAETSSDVSRLAADARGVRSAA